MPEIEAPHIIGYLFEIGPSIPVGMSNGPITQGEIAHWQSNTGIELDAWEARTLRTLSLAYISESHKAKDIDCPAPWKEAPYLVPQQVKKSESLRNALRELSQL